MSTIRCFCLIVFLIGVTGCTPSPRHAADTVEKYRQFSGGKSAWDAVRSIRTNGQYDYGGIQFPFVSWSKAPDLYKFKVAANGKYYAQGFDGQRGWKIDAFKNEKIPSSLTGMLARAMANEADVELEDVFLRTPASDFVMGTDTLIDSHDCAMVHARGALLPTYYFDKKDGALLLRRAVSRNTELAGAVLTTRFSDFRKTGDVTIPFRTVHETGGQAVLTITIDSVVINTPMEDAFFRAISAGK